MAKKLLIVESPAKAKTIENFLGKEFEVKSSYGHIRDLPRKKDAIDIQNSFTPRYEVSKDKENHIGYFRQVHRRIAEKHDSYIVDDGNYYVCTESDETRGDNLINLNLK